MCQLLPFAFLSETFDPIRIIIILRTINSAGFNESIAYGKLAFRTFLLVQTVGSDE